MISFFKSMFSLKKEIDSLKKENENLKKTLKELDKKMSFFEIYTQKQSVILADVAFNQKAVIDFIALAGSAYEEYESYESVEDSEGGKIIVFPTVDDETYH